MCLEVQQREPDEEGEQPAANYRQHKEKLPHPECYFLEPIVCKHTGEPQWLESKDQFVRHRNSIGCCIPCRWSFQVQLEDIINSVNGSSSNLDDIKTVVAKSSSMKLLAAEASEAEIST